MSLFYKLNDGNAVEIPASGNVKYNGTDLTKIIYGKTVVWEKVPAVWVFTLTLSGTYSASASGSHSWNLQYDSGSDKQFARITGTTCTVSKTANMTFSASIPNVALPTGTYQATNSNLKTSSCTIPEGGNIAINATYNVSRSGSGSSGGASAGATVNDTASGTFNIPGMTTLISLTSSAYGSASTSQVSDHWEYGDPFSTSAGVSSQSISASITLTMANLGGWTKGTVSGGTLTVNGTSCTSGTVFAVKDTMSIVGNIVGAASGGTKTITLTLAK